MLKIKCVRTIKYNGKYIPAHTPFDIPDSELSYMLTVGAIVLETIPDEPSPIEIIITSEKPLDEYRRADLIDIAKSAGIILPHNVTKAELIQLIQEEGSTHELSTGNLSDYSRTDGQIQENNGDCINEVAED